MGMQQLAKSLQEFKLIKEHRVCGKYVTLGADRVFSRLQPVEQVVRRPFPTSTAMERRLREDAWWFKSCTAT
jgi:hypothetical protein